MDQGYTEIPTVWLSGARIATVWSGFRPFGPRRGGSGESEVKSEPPKRSPGGTERSEAERSAGGAELWWFRLDLRFVTSGAVGQTVGIRNKRSQSGRSGCQTVGISSDPIFGRMKSIGF